MVGTPIFGIPEVAAAQTQKEVTINNALVWLEGAMADDYVVTFASNAYVLTNNQYTQHMSFTVGSATAASTLTVPSIKKLFVVDNTAGAYAVTVGSAIGIAGGTPTSTTVQVPAGEMVICRFDGSNMHTITALSQNAGVVSVAGLSGTVTLAQLTAQGLLTVASTFRATGATALRNLADRFADIRQLTDFVNADGSAVDPTGAVDAAPALNAALAAGDVRVGPGIWLINSPVVIPNGRKIIGSGASESGPGIGTWFKIVSTSFLPFSSNGTAFTMTDCGFYQTQNAPGTTFTPVAYPFVITVAGGQARLERLVFWGVTSGINLTEGSGAGSYRHVIRDIKGQVFNVLIQADVVTDISYYQNLELWPFWSFWSVNAFTTTQTNAIYAYMNANTDLLLSKRNDNAFIENLFGYGIRTSLHFDQNTTATSTYNRGGSSLAQVSNVGSDGSKYAMMITAPNTSASITNLYVQGYDPASTSSGVQVGSGGILIDDASLDGAGTGITNVVITVRGLIVRHTDYGALINHATGCTIRLTDPFVASWDSFAHNNYAINGGVAGNVCYVSNPLYSAGNAYLSNNAATIAPGGSATSPGLQVGASVGTGLWSDGADIGFVVAGNEAMRIGAFDPSAHIAMGGSSTNLYLSAEGIAASIGWVITPTGTGHINLNGPVDIQGTPISTLYASLVSGKVTASQLPPSVTGAMSYVGTWNASTNTPTLTSGSGVQGAIYKVNVAGTTTLDGVSTWNLGDQVVFDGTTWDKIDGIASEVLSVAGMTGVITTTALNGAGIEITSKKGAASGYAPLDSNSKLPVANLTAGVEMQSNKGVASGYASLDSTGKVPTSQLPSTATTTATTQPLNDSSTNIATTAFVQGVNGSVTTVSVAGNSTVALTSLQAASAILIFTGALTGNINVTVPSGVTRSYIVANNTTGAFTLTFLTTASGSVGQTLAQSTNTEVWSDGTNINLSTSKVPYSQLPTEVQQFPTAYAIVGKPVASQAYNISVPFACTLPANFAGFTSYWTTPPTAGAVFTVYRVAASGGTTTALGTITVNTGGSFSATASTQASVSLAAGDCLRLTCPTTQDSTLSDGGITLLLNKA